MRAPSLLACLSGLALNRFIQALEKGEGLDQEAENKDALYPLPPPLEVLHSDVVKSKSFVADTISLEGGLTLLKGRVNIADVSHAEIVTGKFEGGLRLSKCAVELVNTLRREIQDGQLSFRGKRVLELGCGHGLPGIFACLKGAAMVHFQDLNVEVLRSLTIPNVIANLDLAQSRQAHLSDTRQVTAKTSEQLKPELHYYAGDWADMDSMLSLVRPDRADLACNNDDIDVVVTQHKFLRAALKVALHSWGPWAHPWGPWATPWVPWAPPLGALDSPNKGCPEKRSPHRGLAAPDQPLRGPSCTRLPPGSTRPAKPEQNASYVCVLGTRPAPDQQYII